MYLVAQISSFQSLTIPLCPTAHNSLCPAAHHSPLSGRPQFLSAHISSVRPPTVSLCLAAHNSPLSDCPPFLFIRPHTFALIHASKSIRSLPLYLNNASPILPIPLLNYPHYSHYSPPYSSHPLHSFPSLFHPIISWQTYTFSLAGSFQ